VSNDGNGWRITYCDAEGGFWRASESQNARCRYCGFDRTGNQKKAQPNGLRKFPPKEEDGRISTELTKAASVIFNYAEDSAVAQAFLVHRTEVCILSTRPTADPR
jgi:hypothetical protein